MGKYPKVLALFGSAIVTIAMAYHLAYFIGETFFFDKLFYNKSIAHGYWVPKKNTQISDFGRRSKDALPLYELSTISSASATVLGSMKDSVFTVALIGDSYVWGQGVRFEYTMSQLLEKKLNERRPSRVLSLASSGDDVIENYSKYVYANAMGVDMYIFVLVNNDVLINKQRKYDDTVDTQVYDRLTGLCSKQTNREVTSVRWDDSEINGGEYYLQKLQESYHNPANICVLQRVAAMLPKERALYFVADDREKYLDIYINALEQSGLHIIDRVLGKRLNKYSKYFSDTNKYFRVSKIEDHPSVLAHRMYADILFDELITNPSWGFLRE